MSSDQNFVEFIVDQIENAGAISYRKMFGEYAIYVDGKIVGLVCDNRLFMKPTEQGKTYIGAVIEAPPYPGAKMSFLIEDRLDDCEWLSELFSITAQALPEPKPKSAKNKRNASRSAANDNRGR
jgi:TfoX/Sxy family transcriptional regulator of competence genes